MQLDEHLARSPYHQEAIGPTNPFRYPFHFDLDAKASMSNDCHQTYNCRFLPLDFCYLSSTIFLLLQKDLSTQTCLYDVMSYFSTAAKSRSILLSSELNRVWMSAMSAAVSERCTARR
eukprot:COSAG05_NODE_12949_length_447_cov_1.979885_1_plen_117_part_10